jgi:hypothetical protein
MKLGRLRIPAGRSVFGLTTVSVKPGQAHIGAVGCRRTPSCDRTLVWRHGYGVTLEPTWGDLTLVEPDSWTHAAGAGLGARVIHTASEARKGRPEL